MGADHRREIRGRLCPFIIKTKCLEWQERIRKFFPKAFLVVGGLCRFEPPTVKSLNDPQYRSTVEIKGEEIKDVRHRNHKTFL
jgi:hypothetical protein